MIGIPIDPRPPKGDPLDGKTPLWVRCRTCTHEFIGAYLPMSASSMSAVLGNAHCPACGADKAKLTTIVRRSGV